LKLAAILEGLEYTLNNSSLLEFEVKGLSANSKEQVKDGAFVAISGSSFDGNSFIDDAIRNGAAIILGDRAEYQIRFDNYVFIESIEKKLDLLANNFYQNLYPENLVAVTGTNGKTSIAHFYFQILDLLKISAAAVGTTGIETNCKEPESLNLTTPDILTMHRILADLKQHKCDHAIFEASSHGLHQGRVKGLKVTSAIFSNLTRDHLDYHKTMEEYFQAKLLLFTEYLDADGVAIVNVDDAYGKRIAEEMHNIKKKVVTFGFDEDADYVIKESSSQNFTLSFEGKELIFAHNVMGMFQVYNLTASIITACKQGIDIFEIQKVTNLLSSAKGRMELISDERKDIQIFIDFAHTPDALENAIKSLTPYKKSNLSVLFGAGGDRDKSKRHMMGLVAEKYADKVFVTDDNPRSEDPAEIRKDVMSKMESGVEIADRGEAIRLAVKSMEPGDILLIAGKGHEEKQIYKDKVIEFSDFEIAKEALEND
jgi:UDP-N-acetylmuramoyl-L-alanyl-D-glutamate--2,6-diaminopimelate ligase